MVRVVKDDTIEVVEKALETSKELQMVAIPEEVLQRLLSMAQTRQAIPLDIVGSGFVEVLIRYDGKVLWVNDAETGCVLRISNIHKLIVEDNRAKQIIMDAGIKAVANHKEGKSLWDERAEEIRKIKKK